eukprot:TRINITY_DN20_c13_g1_i2.p1 TRINITY_DN20_c13_g1~~TRINITY_DN20_c13_g1_i2.p1  ORF type:complete len:135 (-),score=20.48 TRINITY_DN20_c13_g1_i2:51-455(-)
MFVCVVCKQAAQVYCDNDKAYLCAKCDDLVHSANCVVSGHIRRPVKSCLDDDESSVNSVKNMQVESVIPVQERKCSFGFDLEAFLCNEEDDCFNMFETKEWEERLDVGFGDWTPCGETLLENTSRHIIEHVALG